MKDQKNIEKDENYTTVYADGIKLYIENGICRLVFYQNELSTAEEEPKLRNDTKLLNFEVRTTIGTIERFCYGARKLIGAYMGSPRDAESPDLIDKIKNHLSNNPFDTDLLYYDYSLENFLKMLDENKKKRINSD